MYTSCSIEVHTSGQTHKAAAIGIPKIDRDKGVSQALGLEEDRMHSGSDRYKRSREYWELRELHRLYGKCTPVRVITAGNGPELGVCTCGRVLKRQGQMYWGWDATIARSGDWVKLTHADKRRIRRIHGYEEYITELLK